jgi:hypothetical protein
MDVNELLNRPVAPEISEAVWAAAEAQKERRLREMPMELRGRLSWSIAAGFQWFPESSEEGDRLVERMMGKPWEAGVKVRVTL